MTARPQVPQRTRFPEGEERKCGPVAYQYEFQEVGFCLSRSKILSISSFAIRIEIYILF